MGFVMIFSFKLFASVGNFSKPYLFGGYFDYWGSIYFEFLEMSPTKSSTGKKFPMLIILSRCSDYWTELSPLLPPKVAPILNFLESEFFVFDLLFLDLYDLVVDLELL